MTLVRELVAHGVDCAGVVRVAAARLGLYFLEYGTSPRPIQVVYDRRDSAASRLTPADVDWTLVRHARLLHVSGITPALGHNLRAVVHRALDEAEAAGVAISFDVNYRSRLWTPEQARACLTEMLPRVQHLFVGAADAAAVFEVSGTPEGVLERLGRLAPRATVALTLGEAGSAVRVQGTVLRPSRRYAVTLVDPLGAGDAYAAGFLWALLDGRGVQEAVDAATALAALKCTIWGDAALVSRPELLDLLASDSHEIRR